MKSFPRPDGQLSRLRGNGQVLPSGGAFVCWSSQSYVTEFARDGTIIQEARFDSEHLFTYRAYKGTFVGVPTTLPALKTFVSLDDRGDVLLVFYVSWNGATEVATWEFLGSDEQEGEFQLLGRVQKTSFETSFAAHSSYRYTRAVARDSEDNFLGESRMVERAPSSSTVSDIQSTSKTAEPSLQYDIASDQSFRESLSLFITTVIAILLAFNLRHMASTGWNLDKPRNHSRGRCRCTKSLSNGELSGLIRLSTREACCGEATQGKSQN